MPTYQYACTTCGHQLEAVQSFTDAPLTECPACAGRLRKLFNSVGIVFKGSGFYRTDSRTAPKEAAAATGSATEAKSGEPATTAGNGSTKSSTPSSSSSSSSASGTSKNASASNGSASGSSSTGAVKAGAKTG